MNRIQTAASGGALLLVVIASLVRFNVTSSDYLSVTKNHGSVFGSSVQTAAAHNSIPSSVCITHDGETVLTPGHSIAIWTLAPTTLAQFQTVMVLGHSLQNLRVDLVLLETSSTALGHLERERLAQVGWNRHCRVPPIKVLSSASNHTSASFDEQQEATYNILNLWGMTQYARIIYMAPDTFLVGGMDDLLYVNVTKGKIAATKEIWSNGDPTFDPNVIVLFPDKDDYKRLLQLAATRIPETERDFLNEAYKDQWQEIGFQHNANISVHRDQPEFWSGQNISVIHYTDPKPFACDDGDLIICEPWLKVYHEIYADATSPCRNLDYQPVEKIAIATLNTGFLPLIKDYVHGSLMLGLSARQHSSIPFDLVHMEQLSKPIPDEHWPLLKSVGWKRCVVDRIPPARDPTSMPQYRDQFTKLQAWRMDMYDSVVYLDSDIWITGPIDHLLSMNLEGNQIAAADDYIIDSTRHGWVNTFNMGVFKIHPNQTEYQRLMFIRESNTVDYEAALSEQGWINIVYNGTRKQLHHRYNANMIALRTGAVASSNVSVLHGTLPKFHYTCKERRFRLAKPYCDAWKAAVKNYTQHFGSGLLNRTDSR